MPKARTNSGPIGGVEQRRLLFTQVSSHVSTCGSGCTGIIYLAYPIQLRDAWVLIGHVLTNDVIGGQYEAVFRGSSGNSYCKPVAVVERILLISVGGVARLYHNVSRNKSINFTLQRCQFSRCVSLSRAVILAQQNAQAQAIGKLLPLQHVSLENNIFGSHGTNRWSYGIGSVNVGYSSF